MSCNVCGLDDGKFLVLLNPHAGRQRASRRLHHRFGKLLAKAEIYETSSGEDARTTARTAAQQGYALIAAAGGDGTVHEVACGILESGSDSTLGVLPLGSANDFAWSLQSHQKKHPASARAQRASGAWCQQTVDVGQVELGGAKSEYFIESLGTGLSGRVTVESRQVQGLQGLPLYTVATLRALRSYRASSMTLMVDGERSESPTLLLSVLCGMREGNFNLAPEANLSDGQFNLVQGKEISFVQALILLPRVALFGLPKQHRQIERRLCREIEVTTNWDLTVHTDGEIVAQTGDGVKHLRIRILERRLRVAWWDASVGGHGP